MVVEATSRRCVEECMRTLADGVHVLERPQRFFGLEVGARMTVLETDAGLLVHSPVVAPEAVALPEAARWVLAPNKLHHLYVGPWLESAEGWLAPGLPEKRPDLQAHGVVQGDVQPFGPDLKVFPLTCFPLANEVVVLHRPSRTLVVSDLVFNVQPDAPWLTRAAMFCACGYPGCRTTLLEVALFRREAGRRELRALLEEDWDRLVLAHGAVIESGGKDALRGAFRWLGL